MADYSELEREGKECGVCVFFVLFFNVSGKDKWTGFNQRKGAERKKRKEKTFLPLKMGKARID